MSSNQVNDQAPERFWAVKTRYGWGIWDDQNKVFMNGETFNWGERDAQVYSLYWNFWNGPYAHGEPERCKPIPWEIRRKVLHIIWKHAPEGKDEEEEEEGDVVVEESSEGQLVQHSLWGGK